MVSKLILEKTTFCKALKTIGGRAILISSSLGGGEEGELGEAVVLSPVCVLALLIRCRKEDIAIAEVVSAYKVSNSTSSQLHTAATVKC